MLIVMSHALRCVVLNRLARVDQELQVVLDNSRIEVVPTDSRPLVEGVFVKLFQLI